MVIHIILNFILTWASRVEATLIVAIVKLAITKASTNAINH
jgi:hypothetical protein